MSNCECPTSAKEEQWLLKTNVVVVVLLVSVVALVAVESVLGSRPRCLVSSAGRLTIARILVELAGALLLLLTKRTIQSCGH
jgi:hypothetical protein